MIAIVGWVKLTGYERPIAKIQREVAASYSIPAIEMVSARRARSVARPRQVAMYLAKQLTPLSLPNIGQRFGNRDHTTVMHAVKQVENLMQVLPLFKAEVELLRARLEFALCIEPEHVDMTDEERDADAATGSAKLRDAILAIAA